MAEEQKEEQKKPLDKMTVKELIIYGILNGGQKQKLIRHSGLLK